MSEVSLYETQLVQNGKTGIPRLLEIAGTKSAYLVFASILAAIAVVAQVTPFATVYLLVRELLLNLGNVAQIDIAYVWRLGWITLGGIAVFGVLTYTGNMLSHIAAFSILFEIRSGLAAKLGRMPMGYFTERTNGSIKKVLHDDVERIELFVAHHILDIVQCVVLPIVSVGALFFFDWRLAVGVIIPLPLAFLAQYSMFSPRGLELYEEWQKRLAAMNGTIVEYVRGMPVVKVFNQTVRAFKRFAADVYAYRDLTLHWVKVSATSFTGFLTLLSAGPLFVLPIALFLMRNAGGVGYVDLVTTVFLFLYIGMGIATPLYKLMTLVAHIVQITTGLTKIDEVLTAPELPEPEDGEEPHATNIEFRNVSFAYGEQTVLDGVSFTVPAGSVTALVGPSGGGKTTIANLVGRLWDVGSGQIMVGGADVRHIGSERLNRLVSTVFQDVFLFFDTIEENIRMGNGDATFDDVVAAAKVAQIHDFIDSLPEGYATKIGEGGTYLSGGEQQRVSLARAILKDAPIVVLDEATAYADPENEARIQRALQTVLDGKTVIIIAHRLYTITDVDQILVIDRGRIVEAGTHRDLLATDGLYRRMWDVHTKARNWNLDMDEGVVR